MRHRSHKINLNLCILLTLVSLASIGQHKTIAIGHSPNNSDTSYAYKRALTLIKTHKLSDLKSSTFKFHSRFWTDEKIIEVFYNDSSDIKGYIILYTETDYRYSKIPKYYSKKNKMTSEQIRDYLSLLDSSKIQDLPSSEDFECWYKTACKDGMTYYNEFSTNNFYNFKYYECPHTSNCKAKVTFNNFVFLIDKRLNTDTEFSKFVKKLPKGCYYNSGPGVRCNYKIKKTE